MNIAKKGTLTTTLAVLIVLFIALIMLSNVLFRGMRLDLTENELYTLSAGTKNILADIDEPIYLYFFFSERATRDIPLLRNYANRVRELLEEFVLYADGEIKLQFIDPLPFSEEEDRAAQFGLQSIPINTAGDKVYLGLAGTNAVDDLEIISFFQPDKEAFLEYELSKLIYSLAHPQKLTIGLLSQLPLQGGFDPTSRQPSQPWVLAEQIEQLFEVRPLDAELTKIDADIDVLMLVHPKNLSEQALYAIDQFILGGGKAIIFVDPHAEGEIVPQNPNNPAMNMMADRSSNLPKLFDAWGVTVDTAEVIGDRRYALQVGMGQGQPPVRHLGILSIDRSGLNHDDVITADLNTVTFATAGFIAPKTDANISVQPLAQSSTFAMPLAAQRVRFLMDPTQLHQNFRATGENYVLAARLQGTVPSAFPDGPPAAGDDADTDAGAAADADHLTESNGPINVIVVADTDILTDRLWVRVQNFFGQSIATAWANNGDFVTNALDNLTGSNDLISIRGRAVATRPFDRVEALEREADDRFRETEQKLQAELRETERKLNELQSGRNDDNPLILSDEQRAELQRFQEQRSEIRKELRQVRHNLDKDIENLGRTLKVLNIGLMPLLISIFAIAMAVVHVKRRKAAAGGQQ